MTTNITLDSIRRRASGPPRIVIYGVPGIGKTTLAAAAPSPVFLPVEDGLGDLDVPSFPQPRLYADVIECIQALGAENHGELRYQTLVVDSIDKLEPMIWDHVCKQVGKKSIADFSYGAGYVAATNEWRSLLYGLDWLRDTARMQIVLIAHSTVARVEPPDSDPYDRWQMRLHKQADAVVCDWADCVLFANYKVTTIPSGSGDRRRGISDGSRVLHTAERAAWRAKNRYKMPDVLPMDWNAIAEFLPKTSIDHTPDAAPA